MTDRGSNISTGRSRAGRRGFTLVELLIVIGIIGVLVGILLPTVGKVRIAGQKVATQSTINRIAQGCEAYFQDHAAYPGPFADVQLVHAAVTGDPVPTAPRLSYVSPLNVTTVLTLQYKGADIGEPATTSENLFLGLCGGLRLSVSTAGVPTFVYDDDLAKRAAGPANLSSNAGKHSQSYLELGAGDISSDDNTRNPLNDSTVESSVWWPATGGVAHAGGFVGDSPVFEFMDRFAKTRPILYMRASRGVTRVQAGPNDHTAFIYQPLDTTNVSTPYQYRPDQIQYAYANIGLKRDGTVQSGNPWVTDPEAFPAAPVDPATPATGTNIKFQAGDERYFVNEQISTGNPTTTGNANNSLVPQQKDKYVLISAGPDGLYGTADDLRN